MSVSTKTLTPRRDTLTITAGNAKPINVIVSQASSEYLYTLSASSSSLNFTRAGNYVSIIISTDALHWNISHDTDWLQFSQVTGNKGSTTVSVTALENIGIDKRSATITISAEFTPTFEISVSQNGEIYPSYNSYPITPDTTGMSSSAAELAAKINLGWNIGNSLEAIGGETAWGNPRVTKALIDLVKQSGFNAIRIPCSWNQNMANSSTAQLKADWLYRVKEVVQYCIDNDMYVLLNIHWDGGWLENNCTVAKQAKANGILPFYWDNGGTGNNGCGIFHRSTNTVFDQQVLDALVQGASKRDYSFGKLIQKINSSSDYPLNYGFSSKIW